jgi:hypothetical protein
VLSALGRRGFRLDKSRSTALGCCAAGLLAMGAYVYFDALVIEYARATDAAWSDPRQYGNLGEAWTFLRRISASPSIAYANTHFVYPLFGFEGTNRVIYVPTRPGVEHLNNLPHLPHSVPGESLNRAVAEQTVAEADARVWLDNLSRIRPDYLFIAKRGVLPNPPELRFANGTAELFQPVFENDAARIYRLRWEKK